MHPAGDADTDADTGAGTGGDQSADDNDARRPPPGDDAELPPDLIESLRQLGVTSRASLDALGSTGIALRSLLAADLALARSALQRTLAWGAVGLACAASAWLLLLAALVVVLNRQFDMPWGLALLACAILGLIVAALAAWQALRYSRHARLRATRRQLARQGKHDPGQDNSGKSADDASRQPRDAASTAAHHGATQA